MTDPKASFPNQNVANAGLRIAAKKQQRDSAPLRVLRSQQRGLKDALRCASADPGVLPSPLTQMTLTTAA